MSKNLGIKIKFLRHDGTIVDDTIRDFFMHYVLLEPYGPNHYIPAAVLTNHSWIELSKIVEFVED